MPVELTPKFVADVKLPAAGQALYWDKSLPGFGLVVTKAGHKSYVCRYRVNGSRQQHRMTIADARVLSLDEARKEAKVIKGAVIRGGDPLAERRKVEAASGNTLQAVCEEFLIRQAGMRITGEGKDRKVTFDGGAALRTGAERYRTFKTLVFPKLGSRDIGSIKRSEINKLLDRIEDENGPAMANHTLAYLRRIFNWHSARQDEFQSPLVRDMARGKGKGDTRRRTLSEDELRAFWRAAEGWKGHPFPALLRFILLTATRRDEAANMPWSELDGDLWTIPAARYKTKLDFELPLSDAAWAVFATFPRPGKRWVFTTDGITPISGFSKWKREFDGRMLAELRKVGEERSGIAGEAIVASAARVEGLMRKIGAARGDATKKKLSRELNAIWWTIHDLRRTARTLMTQAGVDPDHAERALGHTIGGVRGVYDRHAYRKEKRAAFEALAARVKATVSAKPKIDW
jgi:Arm DNA-binding domain/Phage integrase family